MKIPFKYSIRNFAKRKLTTFITITGIALVVFVFAAVLMLAYGIQKTMIATGSDQNVIILRKSSNGEISSIIPVDVQNIIRTLPYLAKTSDGRQIISNEPVVIINAEKISGGLSNVTVRGVSQHAFLLRPKVKIVEGKNFNPGQREIIVGNSIYSRFKNSQIGNEIKFAGNFWKIVGKFESDGSGFDSEMWGDAGQVLDAFNRGNTVSTVTLALEHQDLFEQFQRKFETDKRLQEFEPKPEKKFYEEQSEFLALFIGILGTFITVIFSLGATIGATITMYSSVANRTVEIGTLRALGFTRFSVLFAFLTESIIISLIGGAIGIFIASFLQFFSISTLNYASFSEIAFSFALSPKIVIFSMSFSVAMGLIGGFAPSVRAGRLKIVDALRS